MRQTKLFTKTRKEAPADEVSKNAQLLIRAGYISKEMAGVYTFLPLGLRVLKNIEQIIREEMNAIDGQEMILTALQDKEVWEKTGRFSDDVMDVWFKTELNAGGVVGLAPTHEEPITRVMTNHISSYKDLPVYAYQFQTKFRNEVRAKSGIMRGREFLMKDLYSFDADQAGLDAYYEKASDAYKKIFDRTGVGHVTYKTFASGGAFSKYSHEFQTVCEAGEDLIYVHEAKGVAVNKEVLTDEALQDLGITREELVEKKSIEVGNIFKLGTKFSEPLGLMYTDEEGNSKSVVMGCYGIGPSRLMGTIVELLSDEKGIVWPEAVAPFRVHLVILGNSPEVRVAGDLFYEKMKTLGVETLYDDRELRPGEKFADSDLIGIPTRVVISEKTLQAGKLEVKKRTATEAQMMDEEEFLRTL
ncbi:MAG: His/Gly/Thr/Pro-type tRNA ligase C-terminal domain-containing protein [Candidatus Zambryskibacteria bacterium]|nr:His/Gly/Thr/Pro-type tRNA ligase C-terminal domain-containing protein [Candidatus Zambryskibacteria bacterium]